MTDLVNVLTHEISMITLESEKKPINKFISKVNNMNDLHENDVDSLIEEFLQLEVSHKPHVVNKFYMFILKCIKNERQYVNSNIFTHKEPPMCR